MEGEKNSEEIKEVVDVVPRTLTVLKHDGKYSAERGKRSRSLDAKCNERL